MCRQSISYDLHLSLAFVSVKKRVFEVNFPSPAASKKRLKSFLWLNFLRLVWENGVTSPLPFPHFLKTQRMDCINPGILPWVGTSFGITWLSIRFFFFSCFFSCLFLNQGWVTHWIWSAWQFCWPLWTLPWPQKTQFALFIIFCVCSWGNRSFVSSGQVCLWQDLLSLIGYYINVAG